jgi:hypothetical protein
VGDDPGGALGEPLILAGHEGQQLAKELLRIPDEGGDAKGLRPGMLGFEGVAEIE